MISELSKELRILTKKSVKDRTDDEAQRIKELMNVIKTERDKIKEKQDFRFKTGFSALQTRQEAQKNLLDAGVTPHNDIVKIAQLEGVGSARKVANANKDDLVSNVLGLDAVGKYGAITIGELKDVVAEMPNIMGPNIENGITNAVASLKDDNNLAGPKEKYTSTVANLDVDPTQAVDKEAAEKFARTTETQSELMKEQISKMDQLISHVATSNNIQSKILTSSYA